LNTPIGGPFTNLGREHLQQTGNGHHRLGPMQTIDIPIRRYGEQEVDFVIVGIGAGGGVILQRLARAGFKVIGFDAGPFWDSEQDWVSDEAGSHKLYWEDLRIIGGSDPLALGANNSGRGVGGSTVHWAAFAPRFHPSDFRVHAEDGVGADWPIDYEDIRPYYELLELEIPVAGPYFPWGCPHRYPYGPHPMGGPGNVLIKGCTELGIRVCAGGPVAILSGSREDRPHCIYRGYCIQACKVGAKASTLITHVPDALSHGAEIRDNCMVSRIHMGPDRRAIGVSYFDREGKEHYQKARAVIVAGYSIETPRLLLNSACPGFENGLANSSDTVGRYLMAQAGNVVLGRFPDLIRQYKAPPAHCMTEEFYETDPRRGFARGFAIQTIGPLPIAFAKQMMAAKGAWGWGLRRVMMDYNHWSGLGLLGEILPWPDNRVTIAKEKDRFGIPVARVDFSLHENDKKLIKYGREVVMNVMRAAGAEEVVQEPRYAHLVGAARIGRDYRSSVADEFGRTHDIDNLFICDGSIMPTQGSANPALTIQAFAARAADYIISQGANIFRSGMRDRARPKIRYDLSPPATWGHGARLDGQLTLRG